MKKELQKKLNAYAAAVGSIAVAGGAGAQIVYVDINPDTIVHDSLSTYLLDFDNNSQPELYFVAGTYNTSYGPISIAEVAVIGDSTNALKGSLYYSAYPFPYSLNAGDSISGTTSDWQAATVNGGQQYLGVIAGANNYANWIGVSDKYLGARFKIGTVTHYGWVRLTVVPSSDSIVIKDYAYEALPNVGLTAGQMVGIADHSLNNNVRAFAAQHEIVMINSEAEKGGTIRVLNAMGELVTEQALTEETTHISMVGQATGVYMVELVRNDGVFVKKLYIQQ